MNVIDHIFQQDTIVMDCYGYIYISIYVCVCVCVCVCIYIYIYIYIHTHTIYIYNRIEQCALLVTTIMALRQLVTLGT